MKKYLLVFFIGVMSFTQTAFSILDEPDSAYIFSYKAVQEKGDGGLYFAWSIDGENWHPLNHRFLRSDCSR